jgi:hypothetical protein
VTDPVKLADLRQTPLVAWHPRANQRYVRIKPSQVIGRRNCDCRPAPKLVGIIRSLIPDRQPMLTAAAAKTAASDKMTRCLPSRSTGAPPLRPRPGSPRTSPRPTRFDHDRH